jgi:hypothetical protein
MCKKAIGEKKISGCVMAVCFTLLVWIVSANAQVIKIGDRETIYLMDKLTAIKIAIPNYPMKTYNDLLVVCPLNKTPPWPLFDVPLVTLKKDNNTMRFILSSGHGSSEYYGPLATPLAFMPPNPLSLCLKQWKNYQTISLIKATTSSPDPVYTATDARPPSEKNLRIIDISTVLPAGLYTRRWLDQTWIANVYKVTQEDILSINRPDLGMKAGDLLGFVHVETTPDGTNRADYSIGLAYSTNNGDNWAYCGDIIRMACNSTAGNNNISGIPYIVYKDPSNIKWFYVYFNDFGNTNWYSNKNFNPGKRQCVARSLFNDVLINTYIICSKANQNYQLNSNNLVPKFYKWINSGSLTWSTKDACTFNDLGAQIIPKFPGIGTPYPPPPSGLPNNGPDSLLYDFHSDAAYCSALKKYLITVSNGLDPNNPCGALFLYSSRDGVHWGYPELIDVSPGSEHIEKAHSFFASLNNDASEDCSTVGKEFYIYIPYTYGGATYKQELYRKKISIVPEMIPLNLQLQD